MEHIVIDNERTVKIRDIDPLLMSYNVEFAEVTGGTFWKAYTPEQMAGTEEFSLEAASGGIKGGLASQGMGALMQVYPPIDLYNERLRKLARAFGPVWVRVSGTWATKTYYDFDSKTGGRAPEGYMNVLTKEQWTGVLDFVKAVGAKLMVSVSNCEGLHSAGEPWTPAEAEKLFSFSAAYGVRIAAAEFTNEPNMLDATGFPPHYTAECFRRDQDIFFAWVRENYPDCLLVGPCNTASDDFEMGPAAAPGKTKSMAGLMGRVCGCSDLMEGTKETPDIYSYHFYNGISERLANLMPEFHWPAESAASEDYLAAAEGALKSNIPYRDRYCPGAPMWITEAGDAGGGGDTWASTYLDVLRTLNELGSFAKLTDGVIFHNTLASSDYGFLSHGSFDPRPNYFAVLLWNKLMGTEVYESGESIREGAHVYAHSRRDGREGRAYLVINNSESEPLSVELKADAEVYTLTGLDGQKRAARAALNGTALTDDGEGNLPPTEPVVHAAGTMELPPLSCTFLVV